MPRFSLGSCPLTSCRRIKIVGTTRAMTGTPRGVAPILISGLFRCIHRFAKDVHGKCVVCNRSTNKRFMRHFVLFRSDPCIRGTVVDSPN